MTDCRTLHLNKQACEVQSAYCCIISIPFTCHSYMLHFMVIVSCLTEKSISVYGLLLYGIVKSSVL